MAFASPAPILLLVTLVAAPFAIQEMTAPGDGPAAPAAGPTGPAPDMDAEVHLMHGSLFVPDPTGRLFGADARLWHESCLRFTTDRGTYASLYLEEGATEGLREDLDLHFLDGNDHEVGNLSGPSRGVGLHHEGAIPTGAATLLVCLVDGSAADLVVRVV